MKVRRAAPRLRGPLRKMAILEAATPLFARRGFHGVTTREIAKAAGVSEPILYRHFPSKEALYAAIEALSLGGIPDRRDRLRLLPSDTATLAAAIYFLVDTILRATGSDPGRHGDLIRMFLHSAAIDGEFARHFMGAQVRALHDKLVSCLEAAEAAGHLQPSDVPYSVRVYMAHNMAAMTATHRLPLPPIVDYGSDPDALVDQVTRVALRCVGLTDEAMARYYTPGAWALWRS